MTTKRSTTAQLVAGLERGSSSAESRLIEIFTAGITPGPQLSEEADTVLAHLAQSAAGGSPYSLELLLGLITDHHLTGAIISRHVRDPQVAQDVAQDVLIAVARSIHQFRGEAKFTTWLWALARNTAVSEMRRRSAREAAKERLARDNPDGQHEVDDAADWLQRGVSSLVAERDMLREAVDSLPPMFRETVLLRDVYRLSYSEIADRQGLAINTVRSRLSRGRAMLASRLPKDASA